MKVIPSDNNDLYNSLITYCREVTRALCALVGVGLFRWTPKGKMEG